MKRAWLLLSAFSCVSLTEINLQPARPASPLLLRRLVGGGDASNTVCTPKMSSYLRCAASAPPSAAPEENILLCGKS